MNKRIQIELKTLLAKEKDLFPDDIDIEYFDTGEFKVLTEDEIKSIISMEGIRT